MPKKPIKPEIEPKIGNPPNAAAVLLGKRGGESGVGSKKRRSRHHYEVTMPQAKSRAEAEKKLLKNEPPNHEIR